MKKIYFFVFILVFGILLENELHAQWFNNGPDNAAVSNFAIISNGAGSRNIFAITGSGVYLSTDNGTNWTPVNNGFPRYGGVGSIAASGSKVFAGFNDSGGPDQNNAGLYVTTNFGKLWTPVSGLPLGSNVQAVASSGAKIFAAIDSEVYYSSDNGESWTFSNSGLSFGIVPDEFAFSGSAVLGLDAYGNIYKSTDNGKSWAAADSTLPSNFEPEAITASDTADFVIGLAYSANLIYRSTDNGVTWTAENGAGLPVGENINVLMISGTKLLAGAALNGVYVSLDGGGTWDQADSGIVKNTSIYSFALSGTNIFTGTDDGVFLSSDQASSWSAVVNGMTDFTASTFAVSGPNIFAATGTGVFHSSDNGKTWSGISSNNLPDLPYNSIAVSGKNIFAGADFNGVFLSTDNGVSWSPANGNLPYVRVNALAAESSTVFAGTNTHGIYTSTNNGANWTPADSGLQSYTEVDQFAVSGNNIFAVINGSSSPALCRSSDNGKSWEIISDTIAAGGLEYGYTQGIAVSGKNVFAIYGGGGIILSTDNGSSWTADNNGLPKNANISALAASGKYIFAATDSGLFGLTSNSNNWTPVNGDGLPSYLYLPGIQAINVLAVSESNIFAGLNAGTGIWQRPLSQIATSVQNTKEKYPSAFSLKQNYPNPFNPSTTINYSVAKSGVVTLKVYDVLGRLVRTLVNGYENRGKHKTVFDAENYGLASGVYFYRLKENNFIKTSKMIYLK